MCIKLYVLLSGCTMIEMPFPPKKRLQLSQAQNLGYIQLLAQKESAQQFITNILEKPIHLQKQKHEGKCQPIILHILNYYSYKTFKIMIIFYSSGTLNFKCQCDIS